MSLRTRTTPMNRAATDEARLEETPLLPTGLASSCTGQAPATQEVDADDGSERHREVGQEPKQCRICFEEEETADNPLISPCKCTGFSRYIHRECLAKWRSSALQNPRSKAAFRCEVCHYQYRFVRSDAAGILGHPFTVFLAFLLLLTLACYISGFIPVVQWCLGAFQINFSHIHLLVHMLDGVLMVGLLGLLVICIDICMGNRMTSEACPACGGCWFDCSMFSGDCFGLVGMGEAAGVVCLVVVGLAAILGLVVALPTVYMFLYKKVQEAAGATVRMVENVGHGPSLADQHDKV